jgi:hypothetical protein
LPALEGRDRPACVVVGDDERRFVSADRLLANSTDPLAFHVVNGTRLRAPKPRSRATARRCRRATRRRCGRLRTPEHHRGSTGRAFGAFDILDDGRRLLNEVITGEDPDVIVVTQIRRADAAHASHRGLPLTVVVRFRDGLIVRFDGYRERADALAAVGLSG